MEAELHRYPGYKDCVVTWLGQIPEHWSVERGKNVFLCIDVRSETGDEELLTVSSERGVVPRRTASVTMFKAESYTGYKLCWPGDLVINSLWAWARGLGVSRYHGIISSAYGVYRVRPEVNVLPEFVHELVRSSPFNWELRVRSKGIWTSRLQLTDESFLDAPFPIPPLSEQTAIVRFLSHVDRRIRRYIRAKQKLIKLLQEQKQAIIHRAVTRGLAPSVRLKPSGVEWLGDVPEHWDVSRAGTVCSFLSAKGHEQFVEPDGEHICVTARFVSTDGRNFKRCTENLSPARRGDVLMVMSDLPRGGALARAYLVNDDRSYAVNQRVCILRPVRVHPQFLAFGANRHPELLAHDDGFNQTNLPNAAFKIMSLPLPPFDEQAAIAEFLVRESMVREAAAHHAQREIELFGEYRTRLIADVVTGKLDVREAAARLPDEVEEAEQPDEMEAESAADEGGADDSAEVPEEAEA
jgi:type I restriction enzyme S subunit